MPVHTTTVPRTNHPGRTSAPTCSLTHAHSCTREGCRRRARDRVTESSSSLEASPLSRFLVCSTAPCRTRARHCRAGIPVKGHAFLYPNQALGPPRLRRDSCCRAAAWSVAPAALRRRCTHARRHHRRAKALPFLAETVHAHSHTCEFVRQRQRITSATGSFLAVLLSCPFVMCTPSDSCRRRGCAFCTHS
jgi:hypothetical protein